MEDRYMEDTVGLFSLNIGDAFILNNKKYTITDFRNKRLPHLGKTLHCVTLSEGKVQFFITNWQVQAVKQ